MVFSEGFLKVTLICIGFHIMLIAFSSTSMIFSEIMLSHGYSYLGFHSLAFMYLFWGLGSIFSSKLTRNWGFKKCMIIGGIFNSIWMFGAILPIYKAENPDIKGLWMSDTFIYFFLQTVSIINGAFTAP